MNHARLVGSMKELLAKKVSPPIILSVLVDLAEFQRDSASFARKWLHGHVLMRTRIEFVGSFDGNV